MCKLINLVIYVLMGDDWCSNINHLMGKVTMKMISVIPTTNIVGNFKGDQCIRDNIFPCDIANIIDINGLIDDICVVSKM